MLSPTSAIAVMDFEHVALLTDGRFSGGSHGFVIGHVTPEGSFGRTHSINDGDTITVDAEQCTVTAVSDEEMAQRRLSGYPPEPYATRGTLAKYAQQVSSASEGAVTDKYLD